MKKNIFHQQFTIGEADYTLTKTEISLMQKGKPETLQSIKLNELDTYHECVSYLPMLTLLFLSIYLSGFLVALGLIFTGHVHIEASQSIRLVWGIGLLFYLGYLFRKNYTREWRFYYIHKPEVAFSIPYKSKTKQVALALVEAITNTIKKSEKSSELIVRQLTRYSLLTERELTVLHSKLFENNNQETSPNIIHITEHLK